ncbi:hypothetical protein [Anabaena azotica]|uniref:Uncharacterized protein n=1 Tax=Anabaena azotica FACHB-119 TaxID=947527 RepID=A0ABR8DDV4_9NOST|nr:hypothetical protein [Anabaena azotica]MBD2505173.1 hypothetical protein [Anabaena azotica FACHB-119]
MKQVKHPHLLNPNTTNSVTSAQAEMEKLEVWIRNFVYSFSQGKLQNLLSNAKFLRRHGMAGKFEPFEIISGLAIMITCDSWQEYKQLVAKHKQLAYRIRKLDPEVKMLMLISPDLTIAEITIIATVEKFMARDFIREYFIYGRKGG